MQRIFVVRWLFGIPARMSWWATCCVTLTPLLLPGYLKERVVLLHAWLPVREFARLKGLDKPFVRTPALTYRDIRPQWSGLNIILQQVAKAQAGSRDLYQTLIIETLSVLFSRKQRHFLVDLIYFLFPDYELLAWNKCFEKFHGYRMLQCFSLPQHLFAFKNQWFEWL